MAGCTRSRCPCSRRPSAAPADARALPPVATRRTRAEIKGKSARLNASLVTVHETSLHRIVDGGSKLKYACLVNLDASQSSSTKPTSLLPNPSAHMQARLFLTRHHLVASWVRSPDKAPEKASTSYGKKVFVFFFCDEKKRSLCNIGPRVHYEMSRSELGVGFTANFFFLVDLQQTSTVVYFGGVVQANVLVGTPVS
jgi:hypothetical protein